MKTTKLLFLSLCLGLFAWSAAAQDEPFAERHKLYLGLGGGFGNYESIHGWSATLLFPSDWGVSFSHKTNYYTAANLPNDYSEGLCLFDLLTDCIPDDRLRFSSLKLVREFPLALKQIRLGFEAGPSVVTHRGSRFSPYTPPPDNWFSFRSNYTHFVEPLQTSIGLAVRAKAEFPLWRYAGLEIATFVNVNKAQTFVGAELYLTLGLVRERLN